MRIRLLAPVALTFAALVASLPAAAQTTPKKPAESATAMLRIVCDGAANNAEVSINGVFKGECSVDVPVGEGTLKVRIVKQVDSSRERIFEQEIRMAAGTVKRVDVELGAPQMNARVRREEAAAKAAAVQATTLLKQKAQAGDIPSVLQLADKAAKSTDPASQTEATQWYTKAAELGHAETMGVLGARYLNAIGAEKNALLAEQWWRKGAAAGDGRSMNGLGVLYSEGLGGLPQDLSLSREWVLKSADKENAYGIHRLAHYYFEGGAGFPKDEAKGIALLQKAATLGMPRAMFYLGYFYDEGLHGLQSNKRIALDWYRKAAELGDASAMTNIGIYTRDGGGGLVEDKVAAAEWFRKAADLDEPWGQFNLGRLYLKGEGAPKNETEALKWFRKAAATGNKPAKDMVTSLEAKGVR